MKTKGRPNNDARLEIRLSGELKNMLATECIIRNVTVTSIITQLLQERYSTLLGEKQQHEQHQEQPTSNNVVPKKKKRKRKSTNSNKPNHQKFAESFRH